MVIRIYSISKIQNGNLNYKCRLRILNSN